MSTQKQSTNCTNSTNSPISEIRETSGCSQKTIGEIGEISGPAPKISVIVPVYKVEKYLPECIESVLAQTFTDFELILVDDGSPDNSGAICDAYAARDPRIRVFHKENGGVSSARNLGLDQARGEWIMFVDSDDWIDIKTLSEMQKNEIKEKTLPICGFKFHKFENGFDRTRCRFPQPMITYDRHVAYSVLFQKGFINSPCNKLFSSSIIHSNKIRFKENIKIGEDTIFVTEYFKYINEVRIVPQSLYDVRRGTESAISRYNKNILEVDSCFKSALDDLFDDYCGADLGVLKKAVLKTWFWTIPNELIKKECKYSFMEKIRIIKQMLKFLDREKISTLVTSRGIQKFYTGLLLIKSATLIVVAMHLLSNLSKTKKRIYQTINTLN